MAVANFMSLCTLQMCQKWIPRSRSGVPKSRPRWSARTGAHIGIMGSTPGTRGFCSVVQDKMSKLS